MMKRLIKIIVFVLLLSILVSAANIVTILPSNPTTNDNLQCYVDIYVCDVNIACNSHWKINNNLVYTGPTLSSAFTNPGDILTCNAWISTPFGPNLAGSSSVYIAQSNNPPVITDIPNVVMNEDTTYNIQLSFYVLDPDGDFITWSVSGNTNIDVNIVNGVATLLPVANWNGQEVLTFTADDGKGGIANDNVIVDVLPVNDPIVLNNIQDIIMDEGTSYVLDLNLYIVDVDGDLQDITITDASTFTEVVDFPNRLIILTPNLGWTGQRTFTVTVNDLISVDMDSFLVIVNDINEVPVITDYTPHVSDINIDEGNSLLFSVVAMDPEGNSLTYSWELDGVVVSNEINYFYSALDGDSDHVLEVFVSDGTNIVSNLWNVYEINLNPTANAHGPYVCRLGNNIRLRGSATDPGQEVFSFDWDLNNDNFYEASGQTLLINCGNLGDFVINLRVSDGDGGFDIDSTSLTVINDDVNNQPYFDPVLENQNVDVGLTLLYDINTYDADVGDVLTYSLVSSPSGMVINSNTGLISWTPLNQGIFAVSARVCDDSGFPNACYTETFNVNVNPVGGNENPVVSISMPVDGAVFNVGDNILFSGTGNDFEDGDLSGSDLQWTSNIDGNIGEGNSFSFNDLSIGLHTIILTGMDSEGAIGTDSISIEIVSVALPQCSDGIDNDGDGFIDLLDPGCSNNNDNDETDPVFIPQCSDGIDNDGDGFIDYPNDLGCISAGDNGEREAPVAIAGNDLTVVVDSVVNFDGSGSYDVDGNIVSYLWDFGNGDTATGINVQYTFSSIGTYVVTLTVTDNDGLTDDDVLTVTVTSAGGNNVGFSSIGFYNREHKFEIKEFKVISDVEAGKDIRVFVELENTGAYDENVNLRLRNSRLLLIKEFGEWKVEEGDNNIITLVFKIPSEASGKYNLVLEAYNDNYQDSKSIELEIGEREEFTSLITGGVAGYDISIEKSNLSVWIYCILSLIMLVLIILGIKRILFGGNKNEII